MVQREPVKRTIFLHVGLYVERPAATRDGQ
jgi:hypothetical protein